MADDKIRTISTRIESQEFFDEIEKECERLRISKTELLRQSIKSFLGAATWIRNLIQDRDRLERRIEASNEIREKLEIELKESASTQDSLKADNDELIAVNLSVNKELEASKAKLKSLESDAKAQMDVNRSVAKQRDKFKNKFEHACQMNEILIDKIRELQSDRLLKRAAGVKKINLAKYTIHAADKDERRKEQ